MITKINYYHLIDLATSMGCDRHRDLGEFFREDHNITLSVANGYFQLTFATTKHEQLFKLQYSEYL
jgi:hypothetical protein